MEGRIEGRLEGRMKERKNERKEEWKEGRTEEWNGQPVHIRIESQNNKNNTLLPLRRETQVSMTSKAAVVFQSQKKKWGGSRD